MLRTKRTWVLALLMAAAGCGDALRRDGYVGEPGLIARFRLNAHPTGTGHPLYAVVNGSAALDFHPRRYPYENVVDILWQHTGRIGAPVPNQSLNSLTVQLDHMSQPWTVAENLHHLIVYRPSAGTEFWFGGRRFPVPLPGGYSFVHRTCSPQDPNGFAALPKDTVVELHPLDLPLGLGEGFVPNVSELVDATYFKRCGWTAPPPPSGRKVASVAASALAFAPGSDVLFSLRLPTTWPATMAPVLSAVDAAMAEATAIAHGTFLGRMAVATPDRIYLETAGAIGAEITVLTRTGDVWTAQTIAQASSALVSPQGTLLAYASGRPVQTMLLDIQTGNVQALGSGRPVAWSPEGDRLLVGDSPGVSSHHTVVSTSGARTDLAASVRAVAPPEAHRSYVWGAAGPRILRGVHRAQGDARASLPFGIELAEDTVDTVVVTDPDNGHEDVLIDAELGLIPAKMAVARDGNTLFAWAVNCAGYSRDSCGADLYRISLADRSRRLVFRAKQAGALAVSDDARKLAVSDKDGVVIHDLAP